GGAAPQRVGLGPAPPRWRRRRRRGEGRQGHPLPLRARGPVPCTAARDVQVLLQRVDARPGRALTDLIDGAAPGGYAGGVTTPRPRARSAAICIATPRAVRSFRLSVGYGPRGRTAAASCPHRLCVVVASHVSLHGSRIPNPRI